MAEKTNTGIARFDSGRGNTMEIIFPTVKKRKYKPADFYNERALFLHRNDAEPKLIYQDVYDSLFRSSEGGLAELNIIIDETKIYDNSFLMKNIIKGSDFDKMLKDSNLDYGLFGDNEGNNGRKEQASLIVFDTIKYEIRLERQPDENNTHCDSEMKNVNHSEIDDRMVWEIWIDGEDEAIGLTEELIIIGTIHTHPIKHQDEVINRLIGSPTRTSFTPKQHKTDVKTCKDFKIPFYQLYPVKDMNQVDLLHAFEIKSGDYYITKLVTKNDIFTTEELIGDKCNIVKTTLNFLNGKYEKE